MSKRSVMTALGVAIVLSGAVHAAGDPVVGKKKFDTCTGCHGIPGYTNVYPTYHVPMLAGQTEQYLVDALRAYAKGERAHPTMQAQAQSMSDADMADIAAYLAGLAPETTE
jgi:cytochrome c553